MAGLHLAPMLGKVWAGSQPLREAAFSSLASGISVEAGGGVRVKEWDMCPKWGFLNKHREDMC